MISYQRKEVKIQEWESLQKSKFEAKLRQAEVSSIHSIFLFLNFFEFPCFNQSLNNILCYLHWFEFMDGVLLFSNSHSDEYIGLNVLWQVEPTQGPRGTVATRYCSA